MFTKFIKTTAVLAVISFAVIGCSTANEFNPNKPRPALTLAELESCPPGVDADEAPRWVCNPEEIVSNRFPHVQVGSAHFPNASTHLNKSVAIARARVELAKEMGVLSGSKISDLERGQNGQAETIIGLSEKLPAQILRETRALSAYYDNEGRVHVLVVHDSRSLKEYEPTHENDKSVTKGSMPNFDEFKKEIN